MPRLEAKGRQLPPQALAPQEGEVELPGRVAALTAPPELPPLAVRELVPDAGLRRELGLEGLEDRRPEALSSGQRQRAAVGALLCEEADLYLLDEPLANLDPESREGVLELILRRTAGKALVVVLHGDEALHGRFDRVVELAGPRVLTPGSGHAAGN
ncbi:MULTISPECIES: ATP-binding cassette domain-containing protein [unclassified Meiothermus]|uniref:ATP-binding cassette domain-containing protein n=1 Tax=unclassified Meiothermus TaxID=370471 RepID=UPI001F2AE3D6|nr:MULTISPECIES: ATP-binding cassette domain-containing protein [unclassified Meiothermus]